MRRSFLVAAVAALSVASAASAATAVTETFSTGNAGWTQTNNTSAYFTNGGGPAGAPDSYITLDYTVTTATSGFPVLARATGTAGASGGAFTGSYSTITSVSFYVRQTSSVVLPVGLRLGGATPGTGIAIQGAFVQPNIWTLITIPLNVNNPNIVSFEGTPGADNAAKFANATANVANFQIFANVGAAGYVPPAAAGPILVNVDTVSLAVPEPTAALSLAPIAGAVLLRRRGA